MTESFWAIPDDSNLQTPLSILREQANALSEQTGGSLVGYVDTLTVDTDIEISLQIRVPALHGYTVGILEYSQPAEMYPGKLRLNFTDRGRISVSDENHFISLVRGYLASEPVKRVVRLIFPR